MALDEYRRIMVAVSGASGAVYAQGLLEVLPRAYETIYLTASDNARDIMRDEIDAEDVFDLVPASAAQRFRVLEPNDMSAPVASGSHEYDGLVVIPCSMGVVGRIASGVSDDLVSRAADVCLKERRKLILVVRETPLSLVHLRNMTALAEAGAVILPAAPAFYGKPESISDMVDFVVDRVLRVLGVEERLVKGWGE